MKLKLAHSEIFFHAVAVQRVGRLDDLGDGNHTTIAVDFTDETGCKLELYLTFNDMRDLVSRLAEEL